MKRTGRGLPGCRTNLVAVTLTAILALGCPSGPSRPNQLPLGEWGGDHVQVIVSETRTGFQFDCAHGEVGFRILLEDDGRFRANGVFVFEHGGPVTEGPEDERSAVYEGRLDGRRLTFTVMLTEERQQLGRYLAILGMPPRVFRCL